MRTPHILLATLVSLGAFVVSARAQQPADRSIPTTPSAHFIENKGQWDARARFLLRSPGLDTWITDDGVVYDVHDVGNESRAHPTTSTTSIMSIGSERQLLDTKRSGHVVRIAFDGASSAATAHGGTPLHGRYNYFVGGRSRWASNVRTYSTTRIDGVYRGIDALFYLDGGRPRYDLVVAPGADVSRVAMRVDGAEGVSIAADGSLVIATSVGDLRQQGLFAYQIIDGEKRQVACEFARRDDGRIGFEVGAYDRSKPLVVDPLVYSTYMGGSGTNDQSWQVTADAVGSPFITGNTTSPDFPTTVGAYDSGFNSVRDAFVTKLSVDGSTLVYSTYIGGSSHEYAEDIAVDAGGNAFVTGFTLSSNFPTTSGAFDQSHNGGADAFVARLSSDGSSLVYSTYVGGGSDDFSHDLLLQNTGDVTIVGKTFSSAFPTTTGAYDQTHNGDADFFVSQLRNDGGSLVFSTFVGGTNYDVAVGVDADAFGNIYVCGHTISIAFPTTAGAYSESPNGLGFDNVMIRLNSAGASLHYGTYIGGSGDDIALNLAVDAVGNSYLVGYTSSSDYPTVAAVDPSFAGATDGFVTKLNSSGTSILYSSYLGGAGNDYAWGIGVTSDRRAFIAGSTESGIPLSIDAADMSYNGAHDAFVVVLDSLGSTALYGSYLGGSDVDRAYGLYVDNASNVFVTGETYSPDFPTTYSPDPFEGNEVFVARLHLPAPSLPSSLGFMASGTTLFDNSSDHVESIGLTYTNQGGELRGLEFLVNVGSAVVTPTGVSFGDDIAEPGDWSLQYDVTTAATGSEVHVLLFPRYPGVGLDTGEYPSLLRLHYDIEDLPLCDAAPGGDNQTHTLWLSDVISVLGDGLGSSADVIVDGEGDSLLVDVHNSSSRGDVDCNDRVDVIDLNRTAKVAREIRSFESWQFNRADLAPWSSYWSTPNALFSDATSYGDARINVQDMTLLTEAVLNDAWPDGTVLSHTHRSDEAPTAGTRLTPRAFLRLVRTAEGAELWLDNSVAVGSLQLDLSTEGDLRFATSIADRFQTRAATHGSTRLLIYSENGSTIAPGSTRLATIVDDARIASDVIVGDGNDAEIPADILTIDATSSVARDAASASLVSIAPNPVTGTATIGYSLDRAGHVLVTITDANGRELLWPLDKAMPAGVHELRIDASALPAGLYFVTLRTDDRTTTRSFIHID